MIKSCLFLCASLGAAAIAACGGGPAATNPTNSTATTTATALPTATAPAPTDSGVPLAAPDAGAPATDASGTSSTSAFAAQVAAGAPLYQKYCAECHDTDGSGLSAPPVVTIAKGALPLNPPSDAKDRKTKFQTAFDVGDFVAKAMPPPDKKVTLKPDEVWAIMAWILQKNSFDLGSQTLDATAARTVVLHK